MVLELSSHLSLQELKAVQNRNDKVALAKKIWSEKQGFVVALFDREKITKETDVVTFITQIMNQTLVKLKEEPRSTISFAST